MGVRRDVRTLLKGLKLDLLTIRYFTIAVDYCISNDIDPLEISLIKDVYPIINKEIKNTTEGAIESHMIKAVLKSRKAVDEYTYYDRLGVKKPTVRRLMIKLVEILK